MEVGVQPTSFIPPDAMKSASNSPHYDTGGGISDLVVLIGIILFVASAALAIGSYLYVQYLNGVSTSKQNSIQQAESTFDPTLIQQLSDLDGRMNAAQTILSAHLAPTAFFAALNETTLQTISLNSLTIDATDPQDIKLSMAGIARDVNGVALEDQLFSKGGIIVNPIFSGIDQETNGVNFTVEATINPSALNYESLVSGQAASGVNPIPTAGLNAAAATPTPATSTTTSPFGGAATP